MNQYTYPYTITNYSLKSSIKLYRCRKEADKRYHLFTCSKSKEKVRPNYMFVYMKDDPIDVIEISSLYLNPKDRNIYLLQE